MSKTDGTKPSVDGKSNTLRDELQSRAKVERDALGIITRLAEKCSFEEIQVESMLHRLMAGHYHEVIEERSIAGVCGYPCCGNALTKVSSKQKYHVSLQNKKVYDLEELQMFCSLFCYKASNYIKLQLPSEPIWMRNATPVKLNFLQRNVKIDASKLASDKEIVFERIEDLNIDETSDNEENMERPSTSSIKPVFASLPSNRNTTEISSTLPNLSHIKDAMNEWMSSISACIANLSNPPPQRTIESDYHARAMQFFDNSPEWIFEGRSRKDNTHNSTSQDGPKKSHLGAIPTIENRSQTTIRRRIVKDKLQKSLAKLLERFDLSIAEVWTGINKDLMSFEFSKDNINLKPSEWTIVALILLKRLAQTDSSIQNVLTRNTQKIFIILENLNVKFDDFNHFYDSLVGIENVENVHKIISQIDIIK